MRIEFLLEEPSMEYFLRGILPKILPEGIVLDENCFLRPHNGKSDLKRSIPTKVKAFSDYHEQVKIIILHDQDSNDCKELKRELVTLCEQAGTCPVMVRIVCHELESWYLGDMNAIEKVYPKFKAETYRQKAKFRIPDTCVNPSKELENIIPPFQKGHAAKEISKYISIDENTSQSFQYFISGIQTFLSTLNH